MCPSHGRCHPPIRENHGHAGIGKENRKAIHEAHRRPEPTMCVSCLCIFPLHISPFHVRVTLLTWTASEDYCSKMFLLPLIFEEMAKVKRWGTREKGFMAFLVEKLCTQWKKTLDELRALTVEGPDVLTLPKYHVLPAVIVQWSTLGTLMGVHRLVEPIMGCCYTECASFVMETNTSHGRCSGCYQVQYCRTACQNR